MITPIEGGVVSSGKVETMYDENDESFFTPIISSYSIIFSLGFY